jgi:hypothetical protein
MMTCQLEHSHINLIKTYLFSTMDGVYIKTINPFTFSLVERNIPKGTPTIPLIIVTAPKMKETWLIWINLKIAKT